MTTTYWQQPESSRLEQQRSAIIGRPVKRVVPSWRKETGR